MATKKLDIEGIIIDVPDNVTAEKLQPLATELFQIAEEGRRADRVIQKRKGTVADAMLSVARRCSSLAEFNAAVNWTTIKYKAVHSGVTRMPTVYTQTASDIRRMFNESVDLHAKDDNGELLSYSKLKSMAAKAKRAATARHKELLEKSKPEYLKEFDRMVKTLSGFAVDPTTETYRENCPPIETVLEAMKAAIADWQKQHPVKEEELDEYEGEDVERPSAEPARAQA